MAGSVTFARGRFVYRLFPALFLVVVAACTSVEFTPSPGAGAYRPYQGEVRVLDELPAPGTFERLGIVIARGVRLSDKVDLLEDLKSEAARRGANAIVLQGDVKSRRNVGGSEEKLLGAFALRVKR